MEAVPKDWERQVRQARRHSFDTATVIGRWKLEVVVEVGLQKGRFDTGRILVAQTSALEAEVLSRKQTFNFQEDDFVSPSGVEKSTTDSLFTTALATAGLAYVKDVRTAIGPLNWYRCFD